MSRTDRWIIVGGGASGLAAAFFLKQRGLESAIVERDRTLGGRMGTVRLGDRSLDCGGKNIGRKYTLFRQFAASVGTYPFEYFGLNSSQAIDGKVRTFEARARWRTLVDLTRGVATRDVLRFGHLLWRVKMDEAAGYLGSPLSRTLAARFDDRPASQHFSPEFCRRVIRPMSVRMNGAEPDEIYVGNLGSNLRMILDTYEQFQHGLAPLLHDVEQRYDVRLNAAVESLLLGSDPLTTTDSRGLTLNQGRVSGVRVRSADGRTTDLHGAGVILATPAHASATLTEPILPALAAHLRTVAYHPVTLIVAEYDRPIFTSSVRAFVFGEDEAVSNAGAYGINDLNLVRYTFSGKTARQSMSKGVDAERLLKAGEDALAKYVPFDTTWRRRFVTRQFTPGLCAYAPHHGRLLDRVAQELRTVPGLYLTGDYIQGASIEACFRAASACVNRLAQEMEQPASGDVGLLELHAQREG
jgi:oxygen-dependent protoporphyrinogen oxidase